MEKKGCGIICEYNPFHLGHKYQLEMAKNVCDYTVCVMSGDFVQRGEAAFQQKSVRAKNACNNGADIVLELPFPYSSFGAEGFAYKGVEILTKSGLCSHIMFGSECGDANVLKDIATLLCKDGFYDRVVGEQKKEKSLSFAKARQLIVEKELGKEYAEVLDNPNDILGVEYIKAIIRQGSNLEPVPIKRTTPRGGFDETFASSSYIRKNLSDKENGDFAKSRLPENYDFSGIYNGVDRFYETMLINLAMKNESDYENILEVPKDFGSTIAQYAMKSENYDELCQNLCGKTITQSKVKRMLLFCFFGVEKERYCDKAEYTQVLALSELGAKMLKKYRDESDIVIASRIKDIKNNDKAYEQYSFSRLAGEIFEKCCRNCQTEK